MTAVLARRRWLKQHGSFSSALNAGGRVVSQNIETARRWLEAAYRDDVETCAQLVSANYTYTDHTKHAVAATPEALIQAQQDDLGAWSDRRLVIDRMTETTDGRVVTQFRISNTHTGSHKGVPATGARVTTSVCNLLTLDTQGRVVAEETYHDDLQTMLRLGAVRQA
jgi:steroid delta-isomerase-like uncharacterized protein